MESFFSDALGAPHEYRAHFSDRVGIVFMAKTSFGGGDLRCRPQGSSGPYADPGMYHTHQQIQQVLLDMDKAQLGGH
jgi:hypothetical protein